MPSRPAIEPLPAVKGVLDLFARQPLVALGELHGCQDEADFVNALLHHPDFPRTVQVIVFEIGNARHQAVVDRFVAGEPVAARDLRPVWRDFFGWGFDAPIYEQFFRTVRAVNRTLPPDLRLRVLLGDPPTDWTQYKLTNTDADFEAVIDLREAHYVEVVETQVLAPGRRGLLIAGTAHCARLSPLPAGSTVQRIERKYPGSVHVVMPHMGLGEMAALEPYLADGPMPSLVSMQATWLGELEGWQYVAPPPAEGQAPPEMPPLWQGRTWRTLWDSYLYLGPRDSLTRSSANPAIYRGDEQFLSYLQQREAVSSGVFTVESLLTERDIRFFAE